MTPEEGLEIIYVDSQLIVVEKPGGLLAVPGRGKDKQDCVVNRVKGLFPISIAQPAVHRLDMATSGLMLLAFTRDSHRELSGQFEARMVQKRYVALLDGIIKNESGLIELAFRLDPDNRPYQVFDPEHGKLGVSKWQKIGVEGMRTRVEFTPHTGRTHQLRLHSAHKQGLNCPIVGDSLYGNGKPGDQMFLHASYLCFQHPRSGAKMSFESEPSF